jgi:hypothetical protein
VRQPLRAFRGRISYLNINLRNLLCGRLPEERQFAVFPELHFLSIGREDRAATRHQCQAECAYNSECRSHLSALSVSGTSPGVN